MKKKLNLDEMVLIKGGRNKTASSFCAGFAVGEVAYGIGVAANIWNPVGWIGGIAMLATNAACAINELT